MFMLAVSPGPITALYSRLIDRILHGRWVAEEFRNESVYSGEQQYP